MKVAYVCHVEDTAVPRHLIHITETDMQPLSQAVLDAEGICRLRKMVLWSCWVMTENLGVVKTQSVLLTHTEIPEKEP